MRLLRLPFADGSPSLPAWLLRVDHVDVPASHRLGGQVSSGLRGHEHSLGVARVERRLRPPVPRRVTKRERRGDPRPAPGVAVVASRPPAAGDGHQIAHRGLALGDDARGPQGGLALGRGGRLLPDRRRRGQDHPSSSTALRRGWCASSSVSSGMTDSGSGLWLTNHRNAQGAMPDRPSTTDDKGAARMTYSCPTLLDPHGSNERPTRGPTS